MLKMDNISKLDYELLKSLYPNNLDEIIAKINNNYPVQYLIGYVDFLGYRINVDQRALIPRFETELLVSETIKLIKNKISQPQIIDIATGSGCIAVTLSRELNAFVDALDISQAALDLALENTQLNQADVKLIHKDIRNCDLEKKY